VDHTPVPTGDLLLVSFPMTSAPSITFTNSSTAIVPSYARLVDDIATALPVLGEDSRPPAEPPPVLAASARSVLAVEETITDPIPCLDSSPMSFSDGCLLDLLMHNCPSLPVSTKTPFAMDTDVTVDGSLSLYNGAPLFLSITRVMMWPRMLGFRDNSSSYAHMVKTVAVLGGTPPSLNDGGANICITGDINLLVDIVNIPPLSILVALHGDSTLDDCCTAWGLLPLQLDDGSVHWQICYYSKNAVETNILPQAIVNSSDVLRWWHQVGYRDGDPSPGSIRFDSHDGLISMNMTLAMKDGLYYCPTDIYKVHDAPTIRCCLAVCRIATSVDATPSIAASHHRARSRFVPTSKAKQMESEVWLLHLGSLGVHQLDLLPGRVWGIPSEFRHHPFHFIDHKESALVKKCPAQHSAVRTSECTRHFYMDFGFMRSSTSDYVRPNKATDWVVLSYDGFNSYLLIIDEALRYAWVFLAKSKDPPLDIICVFFSMHGHQDGGCVHTDQGGELVSSSVFGDLLLWEY
jgi:hypothetical protein